MITHTIESYCLIRCANMKWIRWVLLKIQSRHDSVHRQTDGQTDGRTDGRTDGQGDTSIPPYQLRWSGGYNNLDQNLDYNNLDQNGENPYLKPMGVYYGDLEKIDCVITAWHCISGFKFTFKWESDVMTFLDPHLMIKGKLVPVSI